MNLMEELLALKFEKVTEVKMTFDFMLKKLSKEKHTDRIKELQS